MPFHPAGLEIAGVNGRIAKHRPGRLAIWIRRSVRRALTFAAMQRQFRGKRWIFWAKAIIFLGMGGLSVPLGIFYWNGILDDANGVPRPQAGPPMVIIGLVFLIVGMMAAFGVAARGRPLIRCYREGIEFNLVARSSLGRIAYVPALLQVAWSIFSLQGVRASRLRMSWPDFKGARVFGNPMDQVLAIFGMVTDVKKPAAGANDVRFQQFELRTPPKEIADALHAYAGDPNLRAGLPNWE